MNQTVKSILLVDDDQDYKYFFYKAIEKVDPSVHVVTATDGLDALNKLQQFTPDIIILDFNMPRMNGLSLLKQIKNNKELTHIPVVIYSTFLAMFDASEIKQLGATCVCTKPNGFNETIKMVEDILNLADGIRNCA
jgi:CheY-like chemotaxis protein